MAAASSSPKLKRNLPDAHGTFLLLGFMTRTIMRGMTLKRVLLPGISSSQAPRTPRFGSWTAIDARVDRNEIALPDALELMAELLDVLEPDQARRGVLLAQWREQKLATEAPSRPRDPELVRREAEQVAAWQAMPAARRDARELERQIHQLRQPPARR